MAKLLYGNSYPFGTMPNLIYKPSRKFWDSPFRIGIWSFLVARNGFGLCHTSNMNEIVVAFRRADINDNLHLQSLELLQNCRHSFFSSFLIGHLILIAQIFQERNCVGINYSIFFTEFIWDHTQERNKFKP